MKRIYFTVTNDLTYDQRMHRICTTLAENGYALTLVGRKFSSSLPLTDTPATTRAGQAGSVQFKQKRIRCWFNKGKLFYFEYNLRLSCYSLFRRMDAICAIDPDTIIPCHTVSWFKRIPRIYDAHELFTELKEVITRPQIKKIWTRVEKKLVPKFKLGYTVSESIAEEFHRRYGVNYKTIRNVPVLKPPDTVQSAEKFVLYQRARQELNWQNEERKLFSFYQSVFKK